MNFNQNSFLFSFFDLITVCVITCIFSFPPLIIQFNKLSWMLFLNLNFHNSLHSLVVGFIYFFVISFLVVAIRIVSSCENPSLSFCCLLYADFPTEPPPPPPVFDRSRLSPDVGKKVLSLNDLYDERWSISTRSPVALMRFMFLRLCSQILSWSDYMRNTGHSSHQLVSATDTTGKLSLSAPAGRLSASAQAVVENGRIRIATELLDGKSIACIVFRYLPCYRVSHQFLWFRGYMHRNHCGEWMAPHCHCWFCEGKKMDRVLVLFRNVWSRKLHFSRSFLLWWVTPLQIIVSLFHLFRIWFQDCMFLFSNGITFVLYTSNIHVQR